MIQLDRGRRLRHGERVVYCTGPSKDRAEPETGGAGGRKYDLGTVLVSWRWSRVPGRARRKVRTTTVVWDTADVDDVTTTGRCSKEPGRFGPWAIATMESSRSDRAVRLSRAADAVVLLDRWTRRVDRRIESERIESERIEVERANINGGAR